MAQKIFWKTKKEKPRRTITLLCSCGTRYIKTRENQTLCLWCTTKAKKG